MCQLCWKVARFIFFSPSLARILPIFQYNRHSPLFLIIPITHPPEQNSSFLKVEAECSSKALKKTHYTRWCKTPEDPNFCTIPNKNECTILIYFLTRNMLMQHHYIYFMIQGPEESIYIYIYIYMRHTHNFVICYDGKIMLKCFFFFLPFTEGCKKKPHYARWCKTPEDPNFCTIPNKMNARY